MEGDGASSSVRVLGKAPPKNEARQRGFGGQSHNNYL